MMLSRRERTIAIAVGVLAGALVLDQVLVSPLLARLGAANVAISAQQEQIDTAQQTLQNSVRARRKWRDMAGQTLQSDAPAAEGQVLNAVRGWAQDADLSLTSLKPERIEKEKDFQKITIRATATGSLSQVARFLYSIRTASIPIRVSDVQIAARREGSDDLALQVGLATIFLPPETETEVRR
jgi:hypothetical protein